MPDGADFIAWSGLERLELCVFVFSGALLLAIASTAIVNRFAHGKRNMRQVAAGDKIVDLLALGLCIWLGYAFVNEPAQMPGTAALFAVSLLAAAQLSGRFGKLGRCGTMPGSMIRNCSSRVPAAASTSRRRFAAAS